MRFRHRAAAGFATLLLPLAGLVGLASPAQAATSATATYTKRRTGARASRASGR